MVHFEEKLDPLELRQLVGDEEALFEDGIGAITSGDSRASMAILEKT